MLIERFFYFSRLFLKLFGVLFLVGSRGYDFFVRLFLYKVLVIGIVLIISSDLYIYIECL